MNLCDNYFDLFLLHVSKLVDASCTPRPRAICLEWSLELDDNLNFVSTQICSNGVLIDAMKYTSGIIFTQTVGVKSSVTNLPFAWRTWWPLSDITINKKISALFVVSIYIYHIFTNESLTSNSSVALPTIDIYE